MGKMRVIAIGRRPSDYFLFSRCFPGGHRSILYIVATDEAVLSVAFGRAFARRVPCSRVQGKGGGLEPKLGSNEKLMEVGKVR